MSLLSPAVTPLVRVHRLVRRDAEGRTGYMARIDAEPAFPGDYIEDAALVECPMGGTAETVLDHAWERTNHVSRLWWEHAGVECFVPEERDAHGDLTHRSLHGRRSSMVGDLFELSDGTLWLAANCGFTAYRASTP